MDPQGTVTHDGIEFHYRFHEHKGYAVAIFLDGAGKKHLVPLWPGTRDVILEGLPAQCHDAVKALYAQFVGPE
jgi:hypothetical protein